MRRAERYKPGDNMTGFFKVVLKKMKFYYVCDAGEGVLRPKLDHKWYDEVMKNQLAVAMPVAGSIAVSGQESQ
jgi:hypothetical protein